MAKQDKIVEKPLIESEEIWTTRRLSKNPKIPYRQLIGLVVTGFIFAVSMIVVGVILSVSMRESDLFPLACFFAALMLLVINIVCLIFIVKKTNNAYKVLVAACSTCIVLSVLCSLLLAVVSPQYSITQMLGVVWPSAILPIAKGAKRL